MSNSTTFPNRALSQPTLATLLLVVLCVGLYGSLKYAFHISVVEADFSDSAMLWLGFHDYGWKFFKNWHYTSDNWLLSLVPIHFMLFYLFGAKPLVVLLTGWGIFILSLLSLGWIAKKLQAPKSAIILPVILLFFGQLAYSNVFLTYAITHNITNLYGLLSLLLSILWLQQLRIRYLIAAFFTLVFAGVSDPWLLATYLYPLFFASVLMMCVFRKTHPVKNYLALASVCVLVFLCIHTKLFHLLHFLSSFDMTLSDPTVMLQNFYCLFRLIGESFNIVPGSLLPPLYSVIISSTAFCLLLFSSLYLIARQLSAKKGPIVIFALLFLLLSMGAISVSFIITFAKYDNGGRYIINLLFLAPLLIALSLEWFWQEANQIFKYAISVAATLFIVATVSSNVSIWKNQPLAVNETKIQSLMTFLIANHLSQGYGPYWGGEGNPITWLSGEKIRFFPVMFSPKDGHIILGQRSQTSKLWKYFDKRNGFFVFVSNDGEECKDLKLCAAGIAHQFGKPNRVISYQNALIYIWQPEGHQA